MGDLPQYVNRGPGRDCVRFDQHPSEKCWGAVQGSSRGLECIGHWGGKGYKTPEDIRAEIEAANRRADESLQMKNEQERIRQEQREANRWFRPLIDRAITHGSSPWWQSLSEPTLKMVFSMIGEGITVGGGSPQVEKALQEAGLPAIAEVHRRGLEWPVGAYELELAHTDEDDWLDPTRTPFQEADLTPDLTVLTDLELKLWEGCAGQVMDYSCLERGTRQAISVLWHSTLAELKRRGLRPQCLFDMRLAH